MKGTALAILLTGLVLGCSTEPPLGELARIQDDQFAVGNLTRDRAWATGIGCGGNEGAAIAKAQEIAQFNLRSLTGASHYRVQYRVLRQVPQSGQACWEVEAKAVPLRMR